MAASFGGRLFFDTNLLMKTLAYINTDLDIVSAEDLSVLAEVLEPRCHVLHAVEEQGKWLVRMEALRSGDPRVAEHHPARDIRALLDVLHSLTGEAAQRVRTATLDMNIGWQGPAGRPEGSFSLPPDVLHGIAAVGATLSVTVYPPEE